MIIKIVRIFVLAIFWFLLNKIRKRLKSQKELPGSIIPLENDIIINDHDCAEYYRRSIGFRSKLNAELQLNTWALNQIKSVDMFLDSCEEALDYLEIEVTKINLYKIFNEFNDDLVDETFNEVMKESNYVEFNNL